MLFPSFVLSGFFSGLPDQGSPRRIRRWRLWVPPLIYAIPLGGTMILPSISPPVQGGQAPNQTVDPFSGTTALLGLPVMLKLHHTHLAALFLTVT